MNVEKKYLNGLLAVLIIDFCTIIIPLIIFASADIVIVLTFPVERIVVVFFLVSVLGGNIYYIHFLLGKITTEHVDERIGEASERIKRSLVILEKRRTPVRS